MNGLKNCPFCGREMNEVEIISCLAMARIYHANVLKADDECLDHYFTIQGVCTVKEAKEKWNRRLPPCNEAEHDAIGCLGFGKGQYDDEPIDVCMNCPKYTGNISEGSEQE